MAEKLIVLVDYSWLCYRAYYAFSDLEVNKKGVVYKTGALYGAFHAISAILAKFPDCEMYLCVDGIPEKALRKQDTYKNNRDKDSDDNILNLNPNKIREIMMSIPNVFSAYHPQMEADETIAFLAETMKGSGKIVIYSTDMDLRQLVSSEDNIFCAKAITPEGFELEDEMFVLNKWGVYPKSIPLFKAICGDTSDNIVGLYRFPTELAKKIANNFPDLKRFEAYLSSKAFSHHAAHYRLMEEKKLILKNYFIAKLDPDYIPEIKRDGVFDEEYLSYYECSSIVVGIKTLIERNDKNQTNTTPA